MTVGLDDVVLVLNGNYEPLHVCTVRRALGLLLTEKAHLVVNGRGYIRTVRTQVPVPSVIRLRYIVRRPYPQVKLTRREVFRRDGYTCQYCGRQSSRLTVDHVVPRERGGKTVWTNVVTACPECNQRKGNRTPQEAHMRLMRPPAPPPNTARYRFQRYLGLHQEWEPYLEGW